MAEFPVRETMSAAAQVLRATGERWAALIDYAGLSDRQLEAAWAEDAELLCAALATLGEEREAQGLALAACGGPRVSPPVKSVQPSWSQPRANHPDSLMCRVLGASRSGFHAWLRRWPSKRWVSDVRLLGLIHEIAPEERVPYTMRLGLD